MSRGPGRIERVIAETFTAHPDDIFTTKQLGRIAYGVTHPTIKHRVAISRAAANVAARMHWQWESHSLRLEFYAGFYFNPRSEASCQKGAFFAGREPDHPLLAATTPVPSDHPQFRFRYLDLPPEEQHYRHEYRRSPLR